MSSKADMDILEKEANDALELARKAEAGETQPNPAPVTTNDPPPATPTPNAELDALKVQLAAEQARVAELTAKLNAEDGRRGGELRILRESVEAMRVQMQTLADENKRLAQAAVAPVVPPPDPAIEEDDKAFAEQFPTRATREKAEAKKRDEELEKIRQEALEAKKKAESLERQSMTAATQKFAAEVTAVIPTFLTVLNDPAFNQWAEQTVNEDAGMTYAKMYDEAAANLNARRAIRVLKAYEATKAPAPVVPPAPAKPPKPSIEGQATPAAAGGGSTAPVPGSDKDPAKRAKRIAELEYKILTGPRRDATVAERAEYEKLVMEEAAEKDAS